MNTHILRGRSAVRFFRSSSLVLILAWSASGSAWAGPDGANPAVIQVMKLTNGTNNDSSPGPFVPVGSTVTFTYLVSNSGPSLNNVTVRDDNGTPGNPADDFNATYVSGDTNDNEQQLDEGETFTFTASRIATAGQYTNIATASGRSVFDGAMTTDTDPDNHFGSAPAISITKLTNGTNNDSPPGVFVPVGSTVTFTYVVTNPGNVPLSGVTVLDDNGTPGNAADDFNASFGGGDSNGNGLLDTTETWTFTASRIATAGQYTNVGRVTGTPPAAVPPLAQRILITISASQRRLPSRS